MRGKHIYVGCKIVVTRITPAHAGKTKTRHCMCMRTGDHPRACGENDRQGRRDCHRSGSPPRMRGKLSKAKNCFTPPRITPAHAGKTAWLAEFVTIAEDHPRACGENTLKISVTTATKGSPPRMRGKPSAVGGGGCAAGITPAHAGKTGEAPAEACGRWDHPRACGENSLNSSSCRSRSGSPPRMRGKQPPSGKSIDKHRITPAHAGKTLYCLR